MSLKCSDLFVGDIFAIQGLIEPIPIKRKLARAHYKKNKRVFILKYSTLLDELYQRRLMEIIFDKKYMDFEKLGFRSSSESRQLKEAVILKQLRILAFAKDEEITKKFMRDFIQIVTQMYKANTTKADVINASIRLDQYYQR